MNRRDFVRSSLAATAALAAAPLAARPQQDVSPPPPHQVSKSAVLKLCSQASRLPGKTHKEKVFKLIQYGGVGYELHPPFDVKEVLDAIKGTPVQVAAVCAANGPFITSDEAQRRKAVDNAKRLLEQAGELNSTGVIMVPAFNGTPGELQGREAHKVLVDLLRELGEHAVKHKSRMLMEPLNRKECWFLRQCAYAASICKEVNSPGVAMMGDFYHMYFEEPSDRAAFVASADYCRHVHIASRIRVLPGQDERSFVDGFRGLKQIGYQDFVSLECGIKGDPDVEIPKSFAFIKKQWDEATP
jgi:sugar phosphate isomerase/epimerase